MIKKILLDFIFSFGLAFSICWRVQLSDLLSYALDKIKYLRNGVTDDIEYLKGLIINLSQKEKQEAEDIIKYIQEKIKKQADEYGER